MKIVKTQSRWKLHERGFPVAIRFDSYGECYHTKIEDWCKEHFGPQAWYWGSQSENAGVWMTLWGKSSRNERPYFIGFRDPAYITTLVLAKGEAIQSYADIFG